MLTNRDQWPSHIQERYPKPGKPWFLYLIGFIFIFIIGAFVAVGINRVINPPIHDKLLAWKIKDKKIKINKEYAILTILVALLASIEFMSTKLIYSSTQFLNGFVWIAILLTTILIWLFIITLKIAK